MENKNMGRQFSEEDVRKMTKEEFLSLSKEEKLEFRRARAKVFVEERKFTPEKKKELIGRLEELCIKLDDVQKCVDDVRKLLPTEYGIEDFDKMLDEMGDRARFLSMNMQLDLAKKRAAEYLTRFKKEENEDDGSGG